MTPSLWEDKKHELTVSNVKLSCTISLADGAPLALNKEVDVRHCRNFTVVRRKHVYIIFKKQGDDKSYHVNITKIPSAAQIQSSIDDLDGIIINSFAVTTWKVENLTCSLDAGFNIPLMHIFEPLQRKSFVKRLRFNPERFPGMFVTFESNTFLLFSSGKMVIIGADNEEGIRHNFRLLMPFLKDQYKEVQI